MGHEANHLLQVQCVLDYQAILLLHTKVPGNEDLGFDQGKFQIPVRHRTGEVQKADR